MQIINDRLQRWEENESLLGELQNELRQQRRLEDNLFSLTQCIEVAEVSLGSIFGSKEQHSRLVQESRWGIISSLYVEEGCHGVGVKLIKLKYKL